MADKCKSLINRDWRVEVGHVHEEANRATNWAPNKPIGYYFPASPPYALLPVRQVDALEVAFPHIVH